MKGMSISELIRQLKEGAINPKTLDRMKYIKSLMDHGCKNVEIAELFEVSLRTIERDMVKIKKINALKLGPDFQKEVLGEIADNEKSRYQKLLQLLNSKDLPVQQQVKISSLLHKMDVDKVVYLEKGGYVSKTHGEHEIQETVYRISEIRERKAMGKRWMQRNRITSEQRGELADYFQHCMYYLPHLEKEIRKNVNKKLDYFISENIKQGKDYIRGVGPFAQLYCSVLVTNRLCKN